MEDIGKLYDSFRETLLRWTRTWFGRPGEVVMLYLFLLPDLVRLMANLLADHRVFLFDKIFVAGVLLYVISPIDLFPEALTGPFGLVEDLFLALMMLYRLLGNPYNSAAIEELWKGDPKMLLRIQRGCQHIRSLVMKSRRR
ncbi:hypothetical protein CSA56_11215 [candidate division KSB3 bacterium]|uniref:DUF1232 domain-containing protein n=1 Tax=candidate division KSB3 bacterium TaxID=2044937 RepID=A0A2G6KDB3_9BACT|nr:MAG: hypothetical protein CSA56_11215 [candidate division KSB3 bacterium]